MARIANGPEAAAITFTNENDAPTLGNNSLTITEGQTVALSGANLSAADVDDVDSTLEFTVSGVTGGQFEEVANPGVAVTTFTQAQVTAGDIQFVHDGGEAAPAYSVTVSDGALSGGPQAATITFTNQNDAPTIGNNALTITEGQTIVLSATNVSATDVDDVDSTLQFTVSGVTSGQFEEVASPGVAITSFTQAQVTAGDIQFVHDGGEAAPAYSVAVSDGALTDGPQAATITFTNQNDAPALGNNALTITEGQTVVLSGADLSATDVDDADSTLQFTVSGVTGGQFEEVANAGVAITTFTQAQVTAGDIQFVHDGGEAAPAYSVTVSDGALADGPQAATTTFTNQNDAPTIGNNALAITEGQTIVLSATNVSATDVDDVDSTLEFTVSGVTGGQFEEVASPGVAITSFTQAQVTAGDIQFVHDGGEAAPAYSVTVSDGALADGPQAATITFTNQNDAPTLGNNALTITEGQTVVLSGADLSATDVDDADSTLQFTVSGVTGGQFEEVANAGVAITTFTQAQVTAGDIQFVHDGGETAPAYSVTVSDGSLTDGPQAATITFTNQNDAPIAVVDADTTLEGQTVAIDLAANDTDPDDGLDVTSIQIVAGPSNGSVVVNGDGTVDYTHDGSETTSDSFTYSIRDLAGAVSNIATVSVAVTPQNDAPTLGNNALTITEGQTVVLSGTNVSATDVDDVDSTLQFAVSGVTGGQFEEVTSPGVAITTFTQAQVTAGDIQFVHDGGEAAPAYSVTVSDGAASDGPQAATITFTNQNDAPTLGNNALTITEGQTVVLSGADLSATDVDDADSTLQFTVSGVTGGQFEEVASPGVAITTFTQAQVTAGDIQFVHDGGEAGPAYSVTVSDGGLSDGAQAATITFTNQNDAPTAVADADTALEGQMITIDLAVNDTDPDDGLDLTSIQIVTGPTNGSVVVNGDGTVDYTHDGSETTSDSFTYSIRDLAGAVSNIATVSVAVTPQNDAPTLGNNALTITEGQTVVLSGTNVSATDVDDVDSTLQFAVSGVTGGQFEEVTSPGVAITTFTQAQVTAGDIQFVHDGGEAAPAYSVTVSDGAASDGPQAATITFTNQNDAPTLGNNSMTITEGQTVALSGANLSAADVDDVDSTLEFTVSGVTGGQFEEVANPRRGGDDAHAGAGDGGRHPVRARRRRGGAGVLGDGVGRCRERWPAGGDGHVHEPERRADAREQRADDHRRSDGRPDGYGSVGNGRRRCRQCARVHGVGRDGRAVRRGSQRRGGDHDVHAGAGHRGRHPVRARRRRGGAGLFGDGVGRRTAGRPASGDDHVYKPERRAGARDQRADDHRRADGGPQRH